MKICRLSIILFFSLLIFQGCYAQKISYYRNVSCGQDYYGIRFINHKTGEPYRNQKKYFISYLKYATTQGDSSIQTLHSNGTTYEGLYRVTLIEKSKYNYYVKDNKLKTRALYSVDLHRESSDTSIPSFVRLLSLESKDKIVPLHEIKVDSTYYFSFSQVLGDEFIEKIGDGMIKHYFYQGVYILLTKDCYGESPNLIGLNYIKSVKTP